MKQTMDFIEMYNQGIQLPYTSAADAKVRQNGGNQKYQEGGDKL